MVWLDPYEAYVRTLFDFSRKESTCGDRKSIGPDHFIP